MKRPATLIVVSSALFLAASPVIVHAGFNASAKIVVHLAPPVTKNACAMAPSCYQVVDLGSLYPPNAYFAHILVINGDATAGIAGAAFGISYDGTVGSGVDVFSWHSCGTRELPGPDWPAPVSGNMVAWDANTACQRYDGGVSTGVVVSLGYFYLAAYSPDRLAVIPRPYDGLARVTDCSARDDIIEGDNFPRYPSHLGVAGFDRPGYNPCAESIGQSCAISGPGLVSAGTDGNLFTVTTTNPAMTTTRWNISGNATITNQSSSSITVTAGSPGIFTLDYDASSLGWGAHCSKTITVDVYVPAQKITWSGIKALYR